MTNAKDEKGVRGVFLRAFELGETHFDVWLRHFNDAIFITGGHRSFAAHEHQIAMTHWAMLTIGMSAWLDKHELLTLTKKDDYTDALMTLGELQAALSKRYSLTTIRKNLIELKHLRLIEQRGRGENSTIHLHVQALIAVRNTVLEWIGSYADLKKQLPPVLFES